MVKRTIYVGNPAYLSTKDEQLLIKGTDGGMAATIPVEDLGVVIIDHSQVTITSGLLGKLLEHNVAMVTCNSKHHPTGLLLNLDGHTLQSRLFAAQAEAGAALKKQLWKQTVVSKITNQKALLEQIHQRSFSYLDTLIKEVRSGDITNCEARAAHYYWKQLFPASFGFSRDREGVPPNNFLNYGYAILRALVARSLVGSGLLPTLGIFHRNQYNAYCLADDIMEPYRPCVDKIVAERTYLPEFEMELTTDIKKAMLSIATMDVEMDGCRRPLMVAVQRTTASLSRCFEGKSETLVYPSILE